ncbi:MAG: hypothetical protein IKZ87_00100 [Actinomycetaceae bacterium]|nr:hypothetical protein [Actinomycetaceae bacterium]
MQYRVTDMGNGESACIISPTPEGTIRTYWRQPVDVRNVVRVDEMRTIVDAYTKGGEFLGRMEIVREK